MATIKLHTHITTAQNEADRIEGLILQFGERAITRYNVIILTAIAGVTRAAQIIENLSSEGFEFDRVEIVA